MSDFLMWLIGLYPLLFFLHQMWFIIWILLIVICKIDSYLMCSCSLLEVLNQNLKLKWIFGLNSLTFIWMRKKKLAMIAMALNGKTKIFIKFWLFFFAVWFFFGSLDCDCTHVQCKWKSSDSHGRQWKRKPLYQKKSLMSPNKTLIFLSNLRELFILCS